MVIWVKTSNGGYVCQLVCVNVIVFSFPFFLFSSFLQFGLVWFGGGGFFFLVGDVLVII